MTQSFFDKPILSSPYKYPDRHSELDESGQHVGDEVMKVFRV